MVERSASKYPRSVLLISFFCLFMYVFLRADTLSFTHDESLTYTIIEGDPSFAETPNNHLLNTWLIFISSALLGNKELFLRLPNVLAFSLYLYFSYKIVTKKNNVILLFLGATLLLSNSYLLDFFSLARGYGLAIGFSLASLYFLFERNSHTYKQYASNLCLSLFFSLLAAYSNLMYINLNIAIVIIFGLEFALSIQSKKVPLTNRKISYLIFILAINFFTLSILANQLLLLKENNQLYYGGENGFIENTVLSLIQISYNQSYTITMLILAIVIFLFSISIIYLIIHRRDKLNAFSKSMILLILMILASSIQHFLLNALYPVNRTALAFILLFSLVLFYLFSSVYQKNRAFWPVASIIILLIALPLNYIFFTTLNFHATKEWTYDENTKEIMMLIDQQNKNKHAHPQSIRISNNCFFAPSMNYYRTIYNMTYLTIPNREGINKDSDYIYVNAEDSKIIDSSQTHKKIFENNAVVLLEKNKVHSIE